MRTKPLYITSPTHAVALWSYVTSAVIGGFFAIGLLDRGSWYHVLHFEWLIELVTFAWCVAAITGWISAVAASRVRGEAAAARIRFWLIVESFACGVIALVIATYLVGLIGFRGWPAAVTGLLLFGKMAGPTHRIIQIWRELPLLRRAADHPETAEVLAEPSDDEQ